MLRPEEVEMLVCGNPTLNMAALKKVTVYDGYSSKDPTVKYVDVRFVLTGNQCGNVPVSEITS